MHGVPRLRQTGGMQCESERPSGEPVPAAIEDAVAAAVEGGATMDGIVARVRAWGGERADSAEGGWAACVDGLIGLQREAGRFAEEWERDREPGAEGRGARIVIESLRALAFRTMAALGQRGEPVSPLELGRLTLTLQRIDRADRLRVECERVATEASAGAHAEAQDEPWAPFATMPHAEEPPAPDSGWGEDSGRGPGVTPPAPAPDIPADDGGAQDAWGAPGPPRVSDPRGAPDLWDPRFVQRARDSQKATDQEDQEDATVTENARDASEAPDTGDARMAPDDWAVSDAQEIEAYRNEPDDSEWSVVREMEMRRRDRERLLWPLGAPF